MSTNKNYVYIAVIAIILVIGGIWYVQNQQAKQAEEELLAEQRAKWEKWSKTMYLGCVGGEFHPGVQNLGSGRGDELQSYFTAGKLLWPDQKEFKDNLAYFNPLIADSWEVRENPMTGETYIEFKIKDGLKFLDGTPINASAVKYCYEQEALDMPYREQHQWTAPRYWHTHAWKRLEVPDPLTLHMYIPDDGFIPMTFAAMFGLNYANIYSPTSTEKYAMENDPIESFANQVGYGPFKLVEWIPDEREVFQAVDSYPTNPLGPYAGPSKSEDIEYVVVQMYKDPASLRMAVEAGEVDHTVGGIARADIDDMREDPNLIVDYVPYLGASNFLHMNYRPEYAPLNDTRVRKAIQYVIDPNEIVEILGKMRYDGKKKEENIEVEIPAYRHDILHPWDVIEDIAIGYDYDNFEGILPEEVTIGKRLEDDNLKNVITDILVGYGFVEVMNYPLSSPDKELGIISERDDKLSLVKNPVTEDSTCLRKWLLPSLLSNLKENRNKSLPQKFFEIGDVVVNNRQYTKTAGVITHPEAGFTEMKSLIQGFMENMGIDSSFESIDHESFIEGRCAGVVMDEEELGYYGEIHPEVLERYDLENPVIGFEFDLEKLMDLKGKL